MELYSCDEQHDASRVLRKRLQRNVRRRNSRDVERLHSFTCSDLDSLPDQVQNAVCNSGLKIADWLYPVYWTNGAWSVQISHLGSSLLTGAHGVAGFSAS